MDGTCWVCFCCRHSAVYDMNVRIFESVRWNISVDRLDLGSYPHPKEFFLGNGTRTHVNSKGKNPLYRKAPRWVEPATLHHAGQRPHILPTELFRPQLHPNLCSTQKTALEPAPMLVWLNIDHFPSRGMERQPPLFSTPSSLTLSAPCDL